LLSRLLSPHGVGALDDIGGGVVSVAMTSDYGRRRQGASRRRRVARLPVDRGLGRTQPVDKLSTPVHKLSTGASLGVGARLHTYPPTRKNVRENPTYADGRENVRKSHRVTYADGRENVRERKSPTALGGARWG
jgi:hypothetical protein